MLDLALRPARSLALLLSATTAIASAQPPAAQGQELSTNCAATLRGNGPINLRSGPGTSHPIVATAPAGSTVIILNRADADADPDPVIASDRQGQSWYMVVQSRRGLDGLVPQNRRAWVRADLVSLSCPP
ncbi:MAG: hypothetical protein Fur0042_08100 [Cyanophyceae cyanobacterium]